MRRPMESIVCQASFVREIPVKRSPLAAEMHERAHAAAHAAAGTRVNRSSHKLSKTAAQGRRRSGYDAAQRESGRTVRAEEEDVDAGVARNQRLQCARHWTMKTMMKTMPREISAPTKTARRQLATGGLTSNRTRAQTTWLLEDLVELNEFFSTKFQS